MASDPKRGQRLGQLIQQEIAKLLVNEVKDPRVGFATVTEVRTAPDLTLARVFVSILGDDSQRQSTLTGLGKARGFLRRELAHRLKLRQMPELQFELDTTLDDVDRLESVFRSINEGNNDPGAIEAPNALVNAETHRTALAAAAEDAVKDHVPQRTRGNRGAKGKRRNKRGGR